jgi:hypothetical protein
MFRIVGSPTRCVRIARTLEPDVTIEEVLRVPMVRMHTIPGSRRGVSVHHRRSVPRSLGTPLLVRSRFVPGRAHAEEHLAVDELEAAIAGYERIATFLSAPARA